MRPPLPAPAWLATALALVPALHGGTYVNNFNAVPADSPAGAINTALNLGGGQLNGAAANATVISTRKDTNGAGTVNVAAVKSGVGSAAATALRLADRATGSCNAALILPVIDPRDIVTEFTVSLRLLMDRPAGATPADAFSISFGYQLSGAEIGRAHV